MRQPALGGLGAPTRRGAARRNREAPRRCARRRGRAVRGGCGARAEVADLDAAAGVAGADGRAAGARRVPAGLPRRRRRPHVGAGLPDRRVGRGRRRRGWRASRLRGGGGWGLCRSPRVRPPPVSPEVGRTLLHSRCEGRPRRHSRGWSSACSRRAAGRAADVHWPPHMLELLAWVHAWGRVQCNGDQLDQLPEPVNPSTATAALQWLRAGGCPWDPAAVSAEAARVGALEVLAWARGQRDHRWTELCAHAAARGGHLAVLQVGSLEEQSAALACAHPLCKQWPSARDRRCNSQQCCMPARCVSCSG